VLIYNSTVDGGITTMDQLLQKSPLFAEFDAVKKGRVWCTEQDMFQQTSAAARMILDINAVLTQSDPQNLTFLQPVQS
jgi:iron complex transport system substrate-binding protein